MPGLWGCALSGHPTTGIRQVLTRATGTGWEAAYRQDVGALLEEVDALRTEHDTLRQRTEEAASAEGASAAEVVRLRAEVAAGDELAARDSLAAHDEIAAHVAANIHQTSIIGTERVKRRMAERDRDAALRRAEVAEGARDLAREALRRPGLDQCKACTDNQKAKIPFPETAMDTSKPTPDTTDLLDRALAAERLLARLAYAYDGTLLRAPGDAACGECCPGGEMVEDGWLCPVHEVRSAFPVIEVPR